LYDEINKYESLIDKILTLNPNMVNIGMFKVDHTQLITQIQEKCKMVLSEIYSYIAEYTKNQFKELIENLVEIEGILESVKEVSSKSDG